jgi:hypothetical protein
MNHIVNIKDRTMLDYIKNLLPRLKQYSKDLDKIENFVDREWVLIDDGGNNQTYEFMRDGRLVMTLVSNNGTNQHTQIGSWDLLGSGRLLITRPQGALTLNQGFLGDMLLILQESGTLNNPFCCYDPKKISQAEINYHLDQFLVASENAGTPTLLTDKLKYGADGELFTGFEKDMVKSSTYNVFIKGKHTFHGFRRDYNTDKGVISVFQKQPNGILAGDHVFVGVLIAENKQYTLTSKDDRDKAKCYEIRVTNGEVSHISSVSDVIEYVGIVVLLILALALLMAHEVFVNGT